jgi:hypothetical protein
MTFRKYSRMVVHCLRERTDLVGLLSWTLGRRRLRCRDDGFRDGGWLDTRKARPHSDALRVTERFRRTDFGHMQLTITIDDRKAFLKPWTVQARLTLQPDTELVEAFCDNHDKTMEHRRIEAVTEPPSPR